jgi:hypothetical protein
MKRLSLLAACGSLLLLAFSGCASPTQSSAMQTGILPLGHKHSQSVAVQTNGGQPTNPMWTSQIADQDLANAIQASILSNQLFSGVVNIGNADYVLNATIFKIDQPMVGFSMEVGVEIMWSLTPKGATKPVWEKSIHTRVRKGVGDAFAGVTRVRIATEASAKENITQALTEISKLELK